MLLLPVAPGSRRGHPISQMGKSRLEGTKGPVYGHRQVPGTGLRHGVLRLWSASFHSRGCGSLGQTPGAPGSLIVGLLHYAHSASACSSAKWGVTRTGDVICQARCKMRMQGSLLERTNNFKLATAVLSPVQGPTGLSGSLTREAAPGGNTMDFMGCCEED